MTGGIIPKREPFPVDYSTSYSIDPTVSEEPRIFAPPQQKNTADILGSLTISSTVAGSTSGTVTVDNVLRKCILKALDIHGFIGPQTFGYCLFKFYIKRGAVSQIALYRFLTSRIDVVGETILIPDVYLEPGDVLYIDWAVNTSSGAVALAYGMQAHVLIL